MTDNGYRNIIFVDAIVILAGSKFRKLLYHIITFFNKRTKAAQSQFVMKI